MTAGDLLDDVQHALRMFWRSPGFTAAALAALTLGIGANTAIFSVVNAVLLRPLPFAEPDRLVMFQTTTPQGGGGTAGSPAKFQHWREQTGVVRDVMAFRTTTINLTGGGLPEQLRGAQVSLDYFRLFGLPVVRGRAFTPEEDRPAGPNVALLSERLWERRFERDPDILGQVISLGGQPFVIVGVAAPIDGVEQFGPVPDVWIPFQLDPHTSDQGHYFSVAARLAPGVTLEQAQAALQVSATAFREKYPNALQPGASFGVIGFQDALVNNVRPTLYVLLGAVGFVLLMACANVANLLLARAASRQGEIAIRTAIGAGRGRIVRQLLTESVLLAVAGGLLGLGVGLAGIRGLLAINTAGLPRVGESGAIVTLDWRVLVFTVAVAVATGLLFGLVPALQATRIDLATTLKGSSGRSGTGARQRTRSVLVVAEVALAVILLVGSALLIRTALALRSVEPGFDTTNVLTLQTSLRDARFATSEGVEQVIRTGVERLKAMPGVVDASATCCVPLEGGYGLPYTVVGRPLTDGPFHGGGGWRTVSPGYFEVYRIPIRRGRTFTERDTAKAPGVVVINEAMARQVWPDGDPLRDRLILGRGVMSEFASEPERQVIGIVGDVRDAGLNSTPQPRLYVPQAQVPDPVTVLNMTIRPMVWVVRTETAPAAFGERVRQALEEATGLPVTSVRGMDAVVSTSLSQQRFNMWLMTIFGASALLLAAIGIYGLMAYSVQQRTQEIGIRLALGAEAAHVRRMVVWQGMRMAVLGVVIGVAGALGLVQFLTAQLFGVVPRDPVVFGAVVGVLTMVALAAVWIPALRASRVAPLEALREG
jgi:predicted permease